MNVYEVYRKTYYNFTREKFNIIKGIDGNYYKKSLGTYHVDHTGYPEENDNGVQVKVGTITTEHNIEVGDYTEHGKVKGKVFMDNGGIGLLIESRRKTIHLENEILNTYNHDLDNIVINENYYDYKDYFFSERYDDKREKFIKFLRRIFSSFIKVKP